MYPPSALRRLCSVLPLLFCTISCATTTTEDIEARAIIPTSSGMIGIWPPDYSPPSAINTADFSYSTSGTATESKWIGKESSWTSKSSSSTFYSVKISTVSDIPPAITGIAVADLYIEIPPEVSDIILKHAQIACGASAKAKREDGLEKRQNPCAASSSAARWAAAQSEFANGVANDPQFSSLLTDPFEHVPTFTANDIQRAVASIKLAGGAIVTTALRNKVAVSAIFFGLFAATGNIPLQAKVEKQSMANTAYPSTTPPVTTSTSTKSCKATGTVPVRHCERPFSILADIYNSPCVPIKLTVRVIAKRSARQESMKNVNVPANTRLSFIPSPPSNMRTMSIWRKLRSPNMIK